MIKKDNLIEKNIKSKLKEIKKEEKQIKIMVLTREKEEEIPLGQALKGVKKKVVKSKQKKSIIEKRIKKIKKEQKKKNDKYNRIRK